MPRLPVHLGPATPQRFVELNSSCNVQKRTPWQIHRAVIFALLMREIKTRFGGRWMGFLWVLGEPMLQVALLMLIQIMVRGRITRESYAFAIFLVVAYVPFKVCTGLWTQLMNGAKSNLGLFNYRQVKPFDTLVARTILECAIDVFVLIVLLSILAWLGLSPTVPNDWLAYIGTWLIFIFMGMGIGMSLAALIGVLPKIGLAVQVVSLPLYMASGVIMPLKSLPITPEILEILMLNPLLSVVELSRVAFLPGYVPLQGTSLGYPLGFTLVVCTLGMALYRVRRMSMAAGV